MILGDVSEPIYCALCNRRDGRLPRTSIVVVLFEPELITGSGRRNLVQICRLVVPHLTGEQTYRRW
jgi:hypothetical protein